ncbi:helix-turn-helix transcriptional regulator [Campylobacter cuniculorum]|uniref:HTH cro/C1-type domain-containing protein n=2 Tax=Campylobacter cuniculorum TaxID=374106 RepID=A0A1W6BYP5_9BACT|nr:helix-turn-helix transcriptional regulator [Campylobacter cuniculorum]ARJ57216.1 hypothetical protein CCUN_1637 [Campylobacter cuniculorum DSM 23162 = LMG 24588]QOR04657.1 helix-turn-helix transcriptional regulator [Campylobacter cuniculorum]
MLNSQQKLLEIFKKSGLSLSKFANILGKDRRTLVNWIEKKQTKELDLKTKEKICEFFRYPPQIWDNDEEISFYSLLNGIKNEELKIIDEGYAGGLKYIFENENEGSLILHPAFPNPAYRDFIVPSVYDNIDSKEAKIYRQKRGEKMRAYSFRTNEWYPIKSLLEFCFSPIGSFYTKEQKIAILELMIKTFKDNLNKTLYFFDSYTQKIYGLDMIYLSINIKENSMFFKAPLEMFLIEIKNSTLVHKIHHRYTNAKKCPAHIEPKDACFIMELLESCLKENLNLIQTCDLIDEKSPYGNLFKKTLSINF